MKTLIVHLPSGDQSFTSDDYSFGFPDKTGSIEVMKIDGTDHIAFYNAAIEVQTSNPEPTPEPVIEAEDTAEVPETTA